MNVVVAGSGYVGLVTAAMLSHIGHKVICFDINEEKILQLKQNKCPLYEKDLDILLSKNNELLKFTSNYKEAYENADVIFIAVGTPENADGSANLEYVYDAINQILQTITKDVILVIKSTVPIGTNDKIEQYINDKNVKYNIDVVSNPEFLSQGTAVYDSLYASRIIIGAQNTRAFEVMRKIYNPLVYPPYNVPYLEMDRRSAEMVKYASNVFLALKISYINELANLCELSNANIENVSKGMSYDKRIGKYFLNAGIGYGGSCFPKDTKALYFTAQQLGLNLKTVEASIKVNDNQVYKLFNKVTKDFKSLQNKKVAILGATFKPETDDLREAPSIKNIKKLIHLGAEVFVFDPIGLSNLRKVFNDSITYCITIDECIKEADLAMIMTEWKEIKNYNLSNYEKLMKSPFIYDGRNCYALDEVKKYNIYYYSIGREICERI